VSLVAVVGDSATTTSLALAASWPTTSRTSDDQSPSHDGPNAIVDPVVVELDRSGGRLSAWLDVPRNPGLAQLASEGRDVTWPRLRGCIQSSPSGVSVLVAPTRATHMTVVHDTVAAGVSQLMAQLDAPVFVADCGRSVADAWQTLSAADVIVVTHRQRVESARAAAVGVEVLAEMIEAVQLSAGVSRAAGRAPRVMVAVVGARPYRLDEIVGYLRNTFVDGANAFDDAAPLAVDPWAAAVLAGRAGSSRRLHRSPLMASARDLAGRLAPARPAAPTPTNVQLDGIAS
jgi:hypothetical protein